VSVVVTVTVATAVFEEIPAPPDVLEFVEFVVCVTVDSTLERGPIASKIASPPTKAITMRVATIAAILPVIIAGRESPTIVSQEGRSSRSFENLASLPKLASRRARSAVLEKNAGNRRV